MNKKKLVIWLSLVLNHGYSVASEDSAYTLRDLDMSIIARHEETIAKREFRFSLLRKGIKLGSIAVVVAGMVTMYRWAHTGTVVSDVEMADLHAGQQGHNKRLDQLIEDVQVLKAGMQPGLASQELLLQLDKQQAENQRLRDHNTSLKDALNKPFFTGIPGGIVLWLKYIINNSIIGTAVASGAYVIAQHGLPTLFSCLDSVFYTFSYHWFVKNRTHMIGCFEELERVAYAYDNHYGQDDYQRRMFIWSFNQLMAECEYTLAFMQVQNKSLEGYSFVHARHMGVITKHFMEVVNLHKEAVGTAQAVPQGYTSWTEFVKAFRDKLRIEGESYAQNESYIFSRVHQEATTA